MIQLIHQWQIRRQRSKAGIERWKHEVIERLINEIIPPQVPFHYDAAFSFLQRSRSSLVSPVRLTLFFPSYPLAVDVVGIDGRADYSQSSPYIDRSDWDRIQSDLSLKTVELSKRRCPYLIITDTDPIDSDSLRNKVKILTGSNL